MCVCFFCFFSDKLLTVLGIRFMTQEEIARNDSMPESDKEEGDESTESK